jgi:hypothetical protein
MKKLITLLALLLAWPCLTAQPAFAQTYGYNAPTNTSVIGYGTSLPCPGTGCGANAIITSLTVTSGTNGSVTCAGACGFTVGQTIEINGNSLATENKQHVVATDSGSNFTYTDGGGTNGTGTDGVATAGGAPSGAGTIVIPAGFPNTELIRVTDAQTPSAAGGALPGKNGFNVNSLGGSEGCQWDTSDTRFVIELSGNAPDMFEFNPSTYAITQLYGNAAIVPDSSREPTCSHVTPHKFYGAVVCPSGVTGCSSGDLIFVSYDFTSTTTPPTFTNGNEKLVLDISSIAGSSLPSGLVSPNDEPTVSNDDQWLGAIGQTTLGQNNSQLYAIECHLTGTLTGDCYVWNTNTGAWYKNGVSQGDLTIYDQTRGTSYDASTNEFAIHQMRASNSGAYVALAQGSCLNASVNCNGDSFLSWQVGASSVYLSDAIHSSTSWGNHWVPGENVMFYERQFCALNCDGIYSAPLDAVATYTSLPALLPSNPVGEDMHSSWSNNRGDDLEPACGDKTAVGSPTVQTFNPGYAWQNEMVCQQMPSGATWRITHNYIVTNTSAGFGSYAGTMNMSQDGKFALMTSDWGCNLGANDGVSALANCSSNGAYNARSDVFLVVMPYQQLLTAAPSKRAAWIWQ